MALCRLYVLQDRLLAHIIVPGDLVITTSTRTITTRSRAKRSPDQYTMIPLPLKTIKLLVQEHRRHCQVL